MRDINDVLYFRADISPFLVHMTRSREAEDALPAHDALETILQQRQLICGPTLVSDARFGMYTRDLEPDQKQRFFSAICFTETPLSEVHCLLEIAYRGVDLAPYGLVFLKEPLATLGVSPVLYLNNENADKDSILRALCSLIDEHPCEAAQILPLVSVFGQKIQPPGAPTRPAGRVDFRWEREWRYPYVNGPLQFTETQVFIGLCPHEEISDFETLFPPVGFIDPRRSMKWYATKLIEARQRLDIKFSVV